MILSLAVHSQYVWNKSALVWHVTTEARKWGDHLPEVPAGHLSGNPRDPNIPLLLILCYILCVLYIYLCLFLFLRVGVGNPCFWCVSFVVLCICIFFIESASRNPVDPNIPLLLLVRSIQQSLKALTWSAQISFEIYCNPKAAFRLNDVGTKSSIYHNWPTMSTPKLPGISFTLLYSVVRRSSKSRIEILWMLEI